MHISQISDSHLLKSTKKLVIEEKKLTAKVIDHLQEVESRKLYSDLCYGSLFQYCVGELGYSDDAAYRRINAMRVASKVPIVKKKIQSGELSLTNTNLFSAVNNETALSKKEQEEVVNKISKLSKRDCEKELHRLREKKGLDKPARPGHAHKINSSHTRLSINLKDETFDKLKLIQYDNGFTLEATITYLVDKELAPVVAGVAITTRPRARKDIGKGRYIPVQVKENIFNRDKNKCSKCGSKHKLQIDHIKPYALGGLSEERNLRLLCRNCNQREAVKVFGVKKVRGSNSRS